MVKNYELRPYPIRIPPEMRKKLEADAKAGDRSLHAEIMRRLENSFSNANIHESDKLKEYVDLVNVFNRLMDDPKLFQALKDRREALQKIKPLQDFLAEHEDLVNEEIEKHPDEDLEDIVNRVKKRLK